MNYGSFVQQARGRGGKLYYYFRPSPQMAAIGFKRVPLGTDEEKARADAKAILNGEMTRDETEFDRHIRKMLRNLKQRARRKRLDFSITYSDVIEMLTSQRGRCAVSGIAFDLRRDPDQPYFRRPFAPSIDRTDNAKGYELANCRLVCAIANYAMGEWGDEVLLTLARAMVRNTGATSAADAENRVVKTALGTPGSVPVTH